MLSPADVLKVLPNEKSLGLFGIAATTTGSDTDIITSKTKLTPRQCYFRMSKLMNASFIKRKNGKYRITALGKVVYNTQNEN
jgi:predicted transcriptional regulator